MSIYLFASVPPSQGVYEVYWVSVVWLEPTTSKFIDFFFFFFADSADPYGDGQGWETPRLCIH